MAHFTGTNIQRKIVTQFESYRSVQSFELHFKEDIEMKKGENQN